VTTENLWRKSSYSQNDYTCVEVCGTLDRVRDSKNPAGPALHCDVPALLRAIRTGQGPAGS
jgi:hypothetical protein